MEREGEHSVISWTQAKQAKPYSGERQTDRQIDSTGEEGGLIYRETHTSEVEGRTNWSIN